jgi:RNA polymerase sigma-70 factor (ECF subfamily)
MTANARIGLGSASDLTLVEMARAGDADAFDRLIDARLDRAYRMALAILRTDWDARDACQDAFVSAWRELPRLRDVGRFDAWLDRIVVNQCRTLLRKRKARVREISIDESPESPASSLTRPSPAEAVAEEDLVRRAFARLPAEQRLVLGLHHGEGRPVAEIASLLGVPAGTVMWRLYRARRALEKELREVSA